jgi:hypothetical protein
MCLLSNLLPRSRLCLPCASRWWVGVCGDADEHGRRCAKSCGRLQMVEARSDSGHRWFLWIFPGSPPTAPQKASWRCLRPGPSTPPSQPPYTHPIANHTHLPMALVVEAFVDSTVSPPLKTQVPSGERTLVGNELKSQMESVPLLGTNRRAKPYTGIVFSAHTGVVFSPKCTSRWGQVQGLSRIPWRKMNKGRFL